jgi:hypothetical protein
MQHMPNEPYRELRALFDHLVDVVDAARQQLGQADPRLQQLDEVLRQAQAYQQASCERCGAQFEASTLHPESYAVGGYRTVCPRCNRELVGQP